MHRMPKSPSTTRTVWPRLQSAPARLAQTVVFPTPPLNDVTNMLPPTKAPSP